MATPESFETFTLPALTQPIVYAEVREGHFIEASPNEQYSHLITRDLYTCKGITIHDSEAQRGVLAHLNLNRTSTYDQLLEPLVEGFKGDITSADINIVQALVDEDTTLWPTSDMLAEFFMQYNPRSLRIDRNVEKLRCREIGLDLASGNVYSFRYFSRVMYASQQALKASLPLQELRAEPYN